VQNIVIVDYGMANLRSVQKALEKVGCAAAITGDPDRVAEAGKVVLLSGLVFNSLKVS
jgi:glutamine amidotransferase